ncbi:MAG: hypothetical protein KGJ07_09885, partial [Patescibacteria group bacterium]|nr:hypothetical protein [Patescibacteria group bacterium]
LVGINQVVKQIGSGEGGDLTVSFPYKEGEIEKVSYTLDGGFLNIVVKAGEKGLSFQQQDVDFKRSGSGKAPSLVFCVGVPKVADVTALFTPAAGQEVVNIDNHAENEKYGTTVVVDTKWSSVSEQIADFVTLLEPQIELDKDTAQNLLDGIDFATQDFTSPKTSYLAFEVAGILMKKGAIRQRAKTAGQNASDSNMQTSQTLSQYIPPQQQASVQQQPVQNIQPQQSTQSQSYTPVQSNQPLVNVNVQPTVPVQQATSAWQPAQPSTQQPTQQTQPIPSPMAQVQQQFSQSQPQSTQQTNVPKQAPPDWLTPKVYKGSTVL